MTINLEGPLKPDYDKDDTSGVVLESLNELTKNTIEKAINSADVISSQEFKDLGKEVREAIDDVDYMVNLHLEDTSPHGISALTIPVNLVDNYHTADLEHTLELEAKDLFVITENIEPCVEINNKQLELLSKEYNDPKDALEPTLMSCNWRDCGGLYETTTVNKSPIMDTFNAQYEVGNNINITTDGNRLIISNVCNNTNLSPLTPFVRSFITNGDMSLLDFQPSGTVFNNNGTETVTSNKQFIALTNPTDSNGNKVNKTYLQSLHPMLGSLYSNNLIIDNSNLIDSPSIINENKNCIFYYDIEPIAGTQFTIKCKVIDLNNLNSNTDSSKYTEYSVTFPNSSNTETFNVGNSKTVGSFNYFSLGSECQLVGIEKIQQTLTWFDPVKEIALSYATFKIHTKNYFTTEESTHLLVVTDKIYLSGSTIKITNCNSKSLTDRVDTCMITINESDNEVGIEEGIIRDSWHPLASKYIVDLFNSFITLKVKDGSIIIDKHDYGSCKSFYEVLTSNTSITTTYEYKRLKNDLGGVVDNLNNRIIPFRDFSNLPGYKYLIKEDGYNVLHLNSPIKCHKYSDSKLIINNSSLSNAEVTGVDSISEYDIPKSMVILTGNSGNIPITHGLVFNTLNNFKSFADVNFKPNGAPILDNFIKLDPILQVRLMEQELRFTTRAKDAYKRYGITNVDENFKYSVYSINRSGELGIVLFTDGIGYCEVAVMKSKLANGCYVNNQTVNSLEFIGFMSKDVNKVSIPTLNSLYNKATDINMDMYVHDNRPNYAFNYDEHFIVFPNVYGNNGGGLTLVLEYLDKKPLFRNNIYQLNVNNEENNYYPLFIEGMGLHYWNWKDSYRYGLIYTDNSLRHSEPLLNILNNLDMKTVDYELDVTSCEVDTDIQLLIPKGVSCYINGYKYTLNKGTIVTHNGNKGYVYLYLVNDVLNARFDKNITYVGDEVLYCKYNVTNIEYNGGVFSCDGYNEYPVINNKTIKVEKGFNWFTENDYIN